MNQIIYYPKEVGKMRDRALIFHHTDLDGIGVKIVGSVAATRLGYKEIETFKCDYHSINPIVLKRLQTSDISDVGLIIIADISVNDTVAEFINNEIVGNCNIQVVLRDHHATAEYLNKYDWAEVHEVIDGVTRCGTWQLAKAFPNQITDMDLFLTLVDDWDTWKWVENSNEAAKKLNALFQVVGEEKFTEYMMKGYAPKFSMLKEDWMFDTWANSMIEAQQMFIEKIAKKCEESLWTSTMLVKNREYNTGIVFCNNDISDVAEFILSKHKELDILMIVGMPRNISFRTKKQLDIPLGDVAKIMTGSGGGHPQAAGCGISKNQFCKFFTSFNKILNNGSIKINNLVLDSDSKE